jgi:hypothetical protein
VTAATTWALSAPHDAPVKSEAPVPPPVNTEVSIAVADLSTRANSTHRRPDRAGDDVRIGMAACAAQDLRPRALRQVWCNAYGSLRYVGCESYALLSSGRARRSCPEGADHRRDPEHQLRAHRGWSPGLVVAVDPEATTSHL